MRLRPKRYERPSLLMPIRVHKPWRMAQTSGERSRNTQSSRELPDLSPTRRITGWITPYKVALSVGTVTPQQPGSNCAAPVCEAGVGSYRNWRRCSTNHRYFIPSPAFYARTSHDRRSRFVAASVPELTRTDGALFARLPRPVSTRKLHG